MPTASSLAKTSLKSQAAALQQIKERGALYDWSWWYPSGNRPLQQYLGFTAGAGYGQFEHKADSLIAKFKEAGGTVRDWCMSRVTAIISLWLSASSSACHGLLIITVITPLPTKPSATKMPENWSWRTRQLLTCRCVSVMLLRSVRSYRGLSWYQSWKWCSAWWCCRWSSSVAHQSGLSVSATTTASGVDNTASPTGRHRWTGLFHPQERLITLSKNNWKEPRSILMSSADRVAHIDGQLMQCVSNTRASSGV